MFTKPTAVSAFSLNGALYKTEIDALRTQVHQKLDALLVRQVSYYSGSGGSGQYAVNQIDIATILEKSDELIATLTAYKAALQDLQK
jgi:hypothetical protein